MNSFHTSPLSHSRFQNQFTFVVSSLSSSETPAFPGIPPLLISVLFQFQVSVNDIKFTGLVYVGYKVHSSHWSSLVSSLPTLYVFSINYRMFISIYYMFTMSYYFHGCHSYLLCFIAQSSQTMHRNAKLHIAQTYAMTQRLKYTP